MALKFRLAVFIVISVMLELSCVCQGQKYRYLFTVCSRPGRVRISYGLYRCVSFLHSSLELGMFLKRRYFFIIIDKTINKSPSQIIFTAI